MKIALLGTRGIPASYSGFETCVEELGARLVQRGHEVTVYCRSHHIRYDSTYYKGMRLVKLPSIRNKYLDTIVHSFLSSLHATTQGYDVALYFIVGNSPVVWIPRVVGQKTILNVDGLDWKREKWPPPAKRYIRFSEWLATFLPNAFITDSRVVQRYYLDRYGARPPYIAYGAEVEILPPGDTLKQYALEPRQYILFVGRLVPENCIHHLLEAFKGLRKPDGMKCVIVGDAAYQKEYIRSLKAMANEDVVFTGYVFGNGYRELSSNAYCFVETSEVGGTHPALLEAMGFGNCVITNDTAENMETVGSVGFSYDGNIGAASLREVLQTLLDRPDLVAEHRELSRNYVRKHFSWETITEQYLSLFYQVLGKQVPIQEGVPEAQTLSSE
jgi:glycosyltransferase involved in cell wall biosynthesis